MFIRYIARIDDSELSRQAAEFCDLLVETGIPIRLATTKIADFVPGSDGSASLWARHRDLLVTPMSGRFVNIVAGTPWEWSMCWTQRVFNAIAFLDANTDSDGSEVLRSSRVFNMVLSRRQETIAHVGRLFSSEVSCPPLLRVDDSPTLRSAILPFCEVAT